jgi:biotin/methionine sulfoxide reductase
VIRINPADAATRHLQNGQVVRVFNQRGACLAAVGISDDVMPGVVCLRTGAWFDPDDQLGLERHGNPNVLTPDRGTSSLAQGPIAHSCLVQIEAYNDAAPAVMSFTLPEIVEGELAV